MIEKNGIKPSANYFEPQKRLKIKRHFDVFSIRRVVIRGIDPLGDVAIGSAFFREARRLFPDAYILVLVGRGSSQYLEHCPYVDEVRIFSKENQWDQIRRLRKEKFDLIFLLTGNLRAALMAYLAGIPNRVGYDTDGRGLLLTVRLSNELHDRYRGENHFDLLRAIGLEPENVFQRECWVTQKERKLADGIFSQYQIDQNAELIAFNSFARADMRRWDEKNWIDLLSNLQGRHIQPVMFVGPNETQEAQLFLTKLRLENIPVIEEHLLITAAMLEKFKWVVGVDSGFIHLALAVNKPHVIAIYGLLPPASSFPTHDERHQGLIKAELSCAPCYLYKGSDQCFNDLKCMKDLTSEDVLDAMESLA